MKALIFSPYWNSLGGGERYCASLAEGLKKAGWDIFVAWPDKNIFGRINQTFNIDTLTWQIDENSHRMLSKKGSWWDKWQSLSKYDLVFYLSDGSVPLLFGQKNWIHFQVPFYGLAKKNIFYKIKLLKINRVICNSDFTKKIIDREYGVKADVVYPPAAITKQPGKVKENLILSVGRFDETLNAKRQDVLINCFKKMVDNGFKGWRLVLVGGAKPESGQVKELKDLARGYDIAIKTNLSYGELQNYWQKAKIYWHAAGYGIDELKKPERVEHFGISIVEAMSSRCVVLAVGKGGVKEIITDNKNGFFWEKPDDLARKTINLSQKPELLKEVSEQAVKSADRFSKEKFWQKIISLYSSDANR